MYEVTSLSPVSKINFGQSSRIRPEYIQDVEYEPIEDDFSRTQTKEDIERERDAKLAEIRQTQDGFNELAESIEQTGNNKVTRGLSKSAKFAATLVGLAATYTTAKLGSKVTINIMKDLVKSPTIQSGVKYVKDGFKQVAKIKDAKVVKSAVDTIKNSNIAKKAGELAEKPSVKNALELVSGAKNGTKSYLKKHITPAGIQTAVENTLAASTTASVLIDDLAGRNDDRSAMELAMGVSGGDK